MKISFDFDGTLGEPYLQNLAKLLICNCADIFIITSRCDDTVFTEDGGFIGYLGNNTDLRDVAKKLNIPSSNIYFTDGDFKWKKIKELEIDLHFDDQFDEIEMIRRNGGKGILVDMNVYDLLDAFNVEDIEVYFK